MRAQLKSTPKRFPAAWSVLMDEAEYIQARFERMDPGVAKFAPTASPEALETEVVLVPVVGASTPFGAEEPIDAVAG